MADGKKLEKFKRAMSYDVTGTAAKKIQNAASSLDKASQKYTPTFRKLAVGTAGYAGTKLNSGAQALNSVFPAFVWVLAAIILWVVDFSFGFNGIDAPAFYRLISVSGFQGLHNILNSVVVIIVLIFSIFVFIKKRGTGGHSTKSIFIFILAAVIIPLLFSSFPGFNFFKILGIGTLEFLFFLLLFYGGIEVMAFALVIVMLSTSLFYGGFSPGNLAHFIFAIAFWLVLLRPKMNDKIEADLFMAVFLFLDFFFFSILGIILDNNIVANRLFLPIPFLFVAVFTNDMQKSWFTKALIVLVSAFYIFYAANIAISYQDLSATIDEQKRVEALDAFKITWENMQDFYTEIVFGVRSGLNDTIYYSSGDYYTSRVDEKAKEKLGVFLKDLKPLSEKLYEDEQPITLTGKLIANALDEEIKITSLNCYTEQTNSLTREKTLILGRMDPDLLDQPLTIFTSEQDFITCEIPADYPDVSLTPGSKKIVFQAEFDFITSAYLKTYFINKQSYREMLKEDIDPFEHLAIKDRNPVTIYTNGPLIIATGIKGPMVGLDTELENELPFAIILENDWKGKFIDFQKLFIVFPKGITLKQDSDKNTYCFGYSFTQESCSALQQHVSNVGKWCDDSDLNIYSYDKAGEGKDITDPEKKRFIEDKKTIQCKILAEPSDILGEPAYSEHYTRVIAKYTYRLEEDVSVTLKKAIAET